MLAAVEALSVFQKYCITQAINAFLGRKKLKYLCRVCHKNSYLLTAGCVTKTVIC
jgi:hypothetical protein